MPDVVVPSQPDDITVNAVSKVHGPNAPEVDDDAERFTIVVVGDGFTTEESDQLRFDEAIDDITSALSLAAPFTDADLAGAINVWRVDVASVGQGVPRGWISAPAPAPQPNEPDTGGSSPGHTPEDTPTLFGSAHPESGNLMSWDRTLLAEWAATIRPAVDAAVIVVNSYRHGGTRSRNTAVVTLHGTGPVFLHELGHILGLADEYDSDASDRETPRRLRLLSDTQADGWRRYAGGVWRWAVGQPGAPNVYHGRIRGPAWGTPWTGLLTEEYGNRLVGVPIVRREPDACGEQDERDIEDLVIDGDPDTPVTTDTFGAFEGANLYRCEAWRSQFNCMMRVAGNPFCRACRVGVRRALLPYADV